MSQYPHGGELQSPRASGKGEEAVGKCQDSQGPGLLSQLVHPDIVTAGKGSYALSPSHAASPREMDLNTTLPRDAFWKENNPAWRFL